MRGLTSYAFLCLWVIPLVVTTKTGTLEKLVWVT